MMALTSSVLLLSSLLPLVVAHGYVQAVAIDGVMHNGTNVPTGQYVDSPIRAINDIDPVKGATNSDMNCGAGAQKAKLVADAKPGSQLQFFWRSGENTNWPHNTGPMLTYMASCGSTTCDQFDSTQAEWFKIDEVGKSGSDTWVQAEVMNGSPYTMNLPSNVAPGQYLVRHEIIALQLATSVGGAEFYPMCTQINVSGSGTGKPTAQETVKLPGAYSDTDPGIYDPNVYEPGANYTFPGPNVAAFVGSSSTSGSAGGSAGGSSGGSSGGSAGGSSGSGSSGSGSSGGSSGGSPSASNPKPSSTGKCKLTKRSPLAKRHANKLTKKRM